MGKGKVESWRRVGAGWCGHSMRLYDTWRLCFRTPHKALKCHFRRLKWRPATPTAQVAGVEGEGLLYSHLKVAAVPCFPPAPPRLPASLTLSPSKQSNQRHRRWRQIRMPATWPAPDPPAPCSCLSALTAASRGVLCGRGSSSSTVNTSHAERIPKTLPTPFQPTQQPAPPTNPCYAPKPRSHDGRRLGTLPASSSSASVSGTNSRPGPGLAPVQQLKRSKGTNLCKLFSRLFRYAISFLLPRPSGGKHEEGKGGKESRSSSHLIQVLIPEFISKNGMHNDKSQLAGSI